MMATRMDFSPFSDALQRSCNVYFETVANRLGLEGLSYWMDKFGLGRPTGIGIEESRGRVPISYHGPNVEFATWTAGIGQGPVAATPLQMSNVAATIARDGIWMRPTLLHSDQSDALRHAEGSGSHHAGIDGQHHVYRVARCARSRGPEAFPRGADGGA
jgi:cell division protein FtsI/penicillin-binding protein 2